MMKRIVFILVLVLLPVISLHSQVQFKARVSKTELSTGDRLQVNFEISAKSQTIKQRNFTPPDFKGFQKVMGPSTSQEYSYINGRVSSKFVYSYILQPLKTGKLTIGSATVTVDGQTYKTQPLTIKVVKGQANTSPAAPAGIPGSPKSNNVTVNGKVDNAILVAELTKTNPYVNEAVGLVYKLYIPRNYGVVNYNETGQPQFNGFWAQDVDKKISGPYEGEVNGKPYIYYILRKKLLFPQHAGKLVLKPLTLQIDLQVPVYRNFFGMRVPDYEVQRVRLTSGKKVLRVKDLPAKDRPVDFSGAVGNFDFKMQIDKNQIKMDEPVNVSLQVSGTGNLKLFDLPKLKAPEGLEVYEPQHTEQVQTTFAGNKGLVKDDYVIVPNNAGKFIIPAVRFVYFDPKSGQYVTKTSDDIVLFVTGDGKQSLQNTMANNRTGAVGKALDFRFIKEQAHFMSPNREVFYGSKWFYRLIAGSVILAFLLFGYYKYTSNKVIDLAYEKQKKNRNLAQKFLKEAKKSVNDKAAFYAHLEKALHNFLKSQLHIDTAEMTRDNIRRKLVEKGISQKNIELLIDLLNRCDMARYAPASTTKMTDDLADAEQLMNHFK